jgi:cation transporter-like permease
MLMHALVSFISITLAPKTLIGARLLASLLVSAGTMWLLLAAVGAANRWRLTPDSSSRREIAFAPWRR